MASSLRTPGLVLRLALMLLVFSSCTGESADTGADAGVPDGPAAGRLIVVENPVLPGNHPDPHVLRVTDDDGRPTYYLTATAGNRGDIAVYQSSDLASWELASQGLFGRPTNPGSSVKLGAHHYCNIWAPQLVELGPSSYMLSFTAQRFTSPRSPCPAYREDSGVYLAWSSSPLGPFADDSHPWEPLRAGAHISSCPDSVTESIPRSLDTAAESCQGTYCSHIIRLDSEVFRDPATKRWWLAYSWYTNRPPKVPWEHANHGEHVSVVELDGSDPFAVKCDSAVPQVFVGNPHDRATIDRLRDSCEGCGDMLSMTKGRHDEELVRDGYSWGINEGAAMFRRGDYVYMLMNGSAWDSAYYHYFWVAAPTVEELTVDNPNRLVGRLLVPSRGQSFGHGSVVVGPDDESLFLVHHRLRHRACRDQDDCARDVWVSPIEFEDRGDGNGAIYIVPRLPAEQTETAIRLSP